MAIGIISNCENGVDVIFEWKIDNFFNLPETDGALYCSPYFSFGGETWYLNIFPNGSSGNDSSGHMDLELCKYDSDRSIKQSFSHFLKTAEGEKYNEKLFSKEFGKNYPENYHELLRFIPRSELTRRRSELVPEGDLTVVCTMKSSTSVRSAKAKSLGDKLLEAKSEINALKLNYNQALQEKAEAQTKLRVLTNNFKDKEIQLQSIQSFEPNLTQLFENLTKNSSNSILQLKHEYVEYLMRQLNAKKTHIQKKENYVNSARGIDLMLQNASYRWQIAELKQEMEEKERTLKRQIAAQEKKADENRIAACAAEKSLENVEKEVTQLRQRLALLEREQENWANAAKDEIVRPVPKTCVEACTQTLEERFSFNNPPEECGFVTDINHLLKENRDVDVTFELETPNGKIKLFAHKLILAVMSSYFADEFYDKERNEGHQIIPFKGIGPKAFEQMIRYCYGEKLSLRTTEDACALFKVASEFKVISLQNLCHTFLRHTKIEPGSVFSILKISVEIEDQSLQDMCFKILQEKTREVMSAYELCNITPAMVYTLLNLPKLSLNSEYELISWIFDWAKVKSEDKNSSCRSARDYLAKLLRNMNFLALTVKDFVMLTRDNPKIFNSDEIASVSMNIVIPGTREMPVWHNKNLKRRVYTGSN